MASESALSNFLKKYVALANIQATNEDEEIQQATLWMTANIFAIMGLGWGIGYFLNNLFYPGLIPFTYGITSIISSIVFSYQHNFKFYLNTQLFLILVLPFALQVSLGGFVPSSAVIIWAIISPIGAMFFMGTKRSLKWLTAFLVLLFVSWAIDGILPNYIQRDLSSQLISNLFLLNYMGVFGLLFSALFYFINSQETLKESIAQKNQDLIEQSEKLKELDKIKSTFFANISHEFRTPLTIILGMVEKQIQNPGLPPDPKHSDTMQRNAKRLLQLINQLLDLSKLESGEIKLQASKQDIVVFVRNAVALFESMATSKRIDIKFNGKALSSALDTAPLSIHFDQEKIQKVINNLLSNAVKFTPEGEQIFVEVEEAEIESGQFVHISVVNTGTEIPAEKLPRIFDRFFQADAEANRKFEGTGIGLALAKELTELHRGTISVESKMNRTTFTISLPTDTSFLNPEEIVEAQPLEQEIPVQELREITQETNVEIAEARDSDAIEGKLEILVVEDNADLRDFIVNLLTADYNVTAATDGVEGLEQATESIPDLIISDVMMPRMDGYAMCQAIKSNEKTNHIPVILLTAKASQENKIEGLELGADDYLTKPFDEKELGVRVKNLIKIRKQLQEKFRGEINLKPKTVQVSSVHEQFLEKLKSTVEQNLDNADFGVEDLASEMGMSRSQVHRKLKALADQSATKFIRNYRLHRAADLLKQEAGNVTEIAYEVGFNSQTYFSSSFQELFGMSPSAYKEQNGE